MADSSYNSWLGKLGFSPKDRVAILHADDLGMFPSTVPAFKALFQAGMVTSGSIMAPTTAFRPMVEWAVNHPQADLGLHLTLTNEWQNYPWRPLTNGTPAAKSLIDSRGRFPTSVEALENKATEEAVYQELKAQLQFARELGFEPTHLDSHMYALMSKSFVSAYFRIGLEEGIPFFLTRSHLDQLRGFIGPPELVSLWEKSQFPLFDYEFDLGIHQRGPGELDAVRNFFFNLPPGLSYVILHPAKDSAELREHVWCWPNRVAEYELFLMPEVRRIIRESGVHLIDFRQIKAVIPPNSGTSR